MKYLMSWWHEFWAKWHTTRAYEDWDDGHYDGHDRHMEKSEYHSDQWRKWWY